MAEITVDKTACIRCGACVDVCGLAKVFRLEENASSAVRAKACWSCGQCVAVCPTDAIDHESFPLEDCPIIDRTEMPSKEELILAFRARRSVRTFTRQSVPREVIREVISAAAWAPTAKNNQAFDWIALDDKARIEDLASKTISEMQRMIRLAMNPLIRPFVRLRLGKEMSKQLFASSRDAARLARRHSEGEDPVFYHAPVVLIGHAQKGNSFGRDDAIYAAYNAMLIAEQLGLASCQIGYFQIIAERSARLRRMLSLPEGRVPQVAIAIGYPRHTFRRVIPRRTPNLGWNPR